MTDFKEFKERQRRRCEERMDRHHSGHGHIWTGAFILLVGVAALVKASVTDLPDWVFSWKTFLIALGVFIGLKHSFRGGSWFLMILIGTGFLLRDIYPDLAIRRYIWPMVFIVIGCLLMLRPRKRSWTVGGPDEKKNMNAGQGATILDEEETWSDDDFVDATSIFGGAKRNILSKDFKGGDIVNIFGGTELNLSQADFKEKAVIEITTVFGGTKLIVPSNWEVKSEAVTIFGGMEDKRSVSAPSEMPPKVLVLKGTVIFGGIDIRSF
ncbi:MAG: LiaF domain-containing protein [Chitinophagaceae bacterium]